MARGIWKGTMGFGLVSIGVELFSAESPNELSFSMLDRRDHSTIGYRKYNKHTGEEIDGSEIVKGFEIEKGKFVILSNEDFKAANPRATGMIDVIGFVKASEIELIYFDKPYVVGPLKGSEKAYALFVKTLEDTERVGVAQVVIRTRQHIAAIYPHRHAIVVQLMRYHDELRQPADLGIEEDSAARKALRPQELKMAEQLVESMSTEWNPAEFHDEYSEDIMKMIRERAAEPDGKVAVTSADSDSPAPKVLDLMAALKGSLAEKAKEKKSSKAKSPAKRRSTRKSA